jgi:hypothetical protein
MTNYSIARLDSGNNRSFPMFFHHTDDRMIRYLGSEFVRALLGLDACDGAAEALLDLTSGEPLVMPAKMKAQSDDCRYTAQKTTPNGDKLSSLPESKGEIGRPAAKESDDIGVGGP